MCERFEIFLKQCLCYLANICRRSGRDRREWCDVCSEISHLPLERSVLLYTLSFFFNLTTRDRNT